MQRSTGPGGLNDNFFCPSRVTSIFCLLQDVFPPSDDQIWCHVDVESCIADIAYDYTKRKNVFRVLTQTQNEHLFQAATGEEMLKWLGLLQRSVNGETQVALPNSALFD